VRHVIALRSKTILLNPSGVFVVPFNSRVRSFVALNQALAQLTDKFCAENAR
jgi:hypothetical protein